MSGRVISDRTDEDDPSFPSRRRFLTHDSDTATGKERERERDGRRRDRQLDYECNTREIFAGLLRLWNPHRWYSSSRYPALGGYCISDQNALRKWRRNFLLREFEKERETYIVSKILMTHINKQRDFHQVNSAFMVSGYSDKEIEGIIKKSMKNLIRV